MLAHDEGSISSSQCFLHTEVNAVGPQYLQGVISKPPPHPVDAEKHGSIEWCTLHCLQFSPGVTSVKYTLEICINMYFRAGFI